MKMQFREKLIHTVLQRLDEEASNISLQWHNPRGTKTRYFFVDALLPEDLCTEIHAAFMQSTALFMDRASFREKKRTLAKLDLCPTILSDITFALQDARVIEKISILTEVLDLEGDARLYAGGLSMMSKGDFLNPHIDNSHDSQRLKFRRLNALYYVTPDWQEEFGGNLELWDDNVTRPVTICSSFNRLVVMETNKSSWHSVSPVVGEGSRCCVSNYYFSDSSPDASSYFHVTSFTGRPTEHLRRVFGKVDNSVRNFIAGNFNVVAGRKYMNKQ